MNTRLEPILLQGDLQDINVISVDVGEEIGIGMLACILY
jgi:hypothetical protein